MDGAHLMSSSSICSFILIAWRLAPGLIYRTLLRHGSKDRIIHFLLDWFFSLYLNMLQTLMNLYNTLGRAGSATFCRQGPATFLLILGFNIHFNCFFLPPFKRNLFSSRWPSPHTSFAECCGWKFQKPAQFKAATPHRKHRSLWQSNKNRALSPQDPRATLWVAELCLTLPVVFL